MDVVPSLVSAAIRRRKMIVLSWCGERDGTRRKLCMRGSKRRKVTFPYYTYMAPVASTLDHTINSFASLDACMHADIA
jgi:hypothetical protein